MFGKRIALRVTTLSSMIALALPVMAAENYNTYRHHNPDRYSRQDVVGGNGLPSHIKGIGTYAGSISGVRFKGNGIYFYKENRPAYWQANGTTQQTLAPKAKIIHVNARTTGAECSYEAGVCVIRP
jgi:hypothetical protein